MQRSTWTAPTFEEIDLEGEQLEARDDADDSSLLRGRDTHIRLRLHERRGSPALPPREGR
jgi:hypothetical protein